MEFAAWNLVPWRRPAEPGSFAMRCAAVVFAASLAALAGAAASTSQPASHWTAEHAQAAAAAPVPARANGLNRAAAAAVSSSAFAPGAEWRDVHGDLIRAHAGHLILIGGLYHWYGMEYIGAGSPTSGVHTGAPFCTCYTHLLLTATPKQQLTNSPRSERVRVAGPLQLDTRGYRHQVRPLHLAAEGDP